MPIISRDCFKMDKPNYTMLTTGGQAIWCDVVNKPFPMLLTIQQNPVNTDFPLSIKGRNLDTDTRPKSYKFIAELVETYFIRNDINLWRAICSTNLFGIWEPQAPFNRFANCKAKTYQYRIVLLRVSEINETCLNSSIYKVNNMLNRIDDDFDTDITIKERVIDDVSFYALKSQLELLIRPYLR